MDQPSSNPKVRKRVESNVSARKNDKKRKSSGEKVETNLLDVVPPSKSSSRQFEDLTSNISGTSPTENAINESGTPTMKGVYSAAKFVLESLKKEPDSIESPSSVKSLSENPNKTDSTDLAGQTIAVPSLDGTLDPHFRISSKSSLLPYESVLSFDGNNVSSQANPKAESTSTPSKPVIFQYEHMDIDKDQNSQVESPSSVKAPLHSYERVLTFDDSSVSSQANLQAESTSTPSKPVIFQYEYMDIDKDQIESDSKCPTNEKTKRLDTNSVIFEHQSHVNRHPLLSTSSEVQGEKSRDLTEEDIRNLGNVVKSLDGALLEALRESLEEKSMTQEEASTSTDDVRRLEDLHSDKDFDPKITGFHSVKDAAYHLVKLVDAELVLGSRGGQLPKAKKDFIKNLKAAMKENHLSMTLEQLSRYYYRLMPPNLLEPSKTFQKSENQIFLSTPDNKAEDTVSQLSEEASGLSVHDGHEAREKKRLIRSLVKKVIRRIPHEIFKALGHKLEDPADVSKRTPGKQPFSHWTRMDALRKKDKSITDEEAVLGLKILFLDNRQFSEKIAFNQAIDGLLKDAKIPIQKLTDLDIKIKTNTSGQFLPHVAQFAGHRSNLGKWSNDNVSEVSSIGYVTDTTQKSHKTDKTFRSGYSDKSEQKDQYQSLPEEIQPRKWGRQMLKIHLRRYMNAHALGAREKDLLLGIDADCKFQEATKSSKLLEAVWKATPWAQQNDDMTLLTKDLLFNQGRLSEDQTVGFGEGRELSKDETGVIRERLLVCLEAQNSYLEGVKNQVSQKLQLSDYNSEVTLEQMKEHIRGEVQNILGIDDCDKVISWIAKQQINEYACAKERKLFEEEVADFGKKKILSADEINIIRKSILEYMEGEKAKNQINNNQIFKGGDIAAIADQISKGDDITVIANQIEKESGDKAIADQIRRGEDITILVNQLYSENNHKAIANQIEKENGDKEIVDQLRGGEDIKVVIGQIEKKGGNQAIADRIRWHMRNRAIIDQMRGYIYSKEIAEKIKENIYNNVRDILGTDDCDNLIKCIASQQINEYMREGDRKFLGTNECNAVWNSIYEEQIELYEQNEVKNALKKFSAFEENLLDEAWKKATGSENDNKITNLADELFLYGGVKDSPDEQIKAYLEQRLSKEEIKAIQDQLFVYMESLMRLKPGELDPWERDIIIDQLTQELMSYTHEQDREDLGDYNIYSDLGEEELKTLHEKNIEIYKHTLDKFKKVTTKNDGETNFDVLESAWEKTSSNLLEDRITKLAEELWFYGGFSDDQIAEFGAEGKLSEGEVKVIQQKLLEGFNNLPPNQSFNQQELDIIINWLTEKQIEPYMRKVSHSNESGLAAPSHQQADNPYKIQPSFNPHGLEHIEHIQEETAGVYNPYLHPIKITTDPYTGDTLMKPTRQEQRDQGLKTKNITEMLQRQHDNKSKTSSENTDTNDTSTLRHRHTENRQSTDE